MQKVSRHYVKAFAAYSDESLRRWFEAIGTHAEHRVKKTGLIKLRWAKYGDVILAELSRRENARDIANQRAYECAVGK